MPASIFNPILLFCISDPVCAFVKVEPNDDLVLVAGVAVVDDPVVEIEYEVWVIETEDEAGGPVNAPMVAPSKRNTALEVLQQRCLSPSDSQQYVASSAYPWAPHSQIWTSPA